MKIAVAMSGGVDFSVTAALLQQQGHEVIGITMRLFPPHIEGPGAAAHDAAAVAGHLGIPHHIADFKDDFRELIINDFIDEYRFGRTPNPCVRCNRHIKFGLLLEMAQRLGAERLATGHYARNTIDADGHCHLRTARFISKDQSYFLYTLTQEKLQKVIFPLGEMESKNEVRCLAREMGLPVSEKGESQEVCFIPDDDYVTFLENSCGSLAVPGDIVHANGGVLGRHLGTHRYTIGQRKGLGIAWKEPLYVTGIDVGRNMIEVGEAKLLFAEGLQAIDAVWNGRPNKDAFSASCKIRYRHQPVACQVRLLPDSCCQVFFNEPQKAVTPGQAVVFYQEDEVLGGARITGALH